MQSSINLYTDGSSDYKKGLVGSGAVLVQNDKVVAEVVKEVDKPGLIKYNNVAGEILACCYGIEKCIELGYKQVIVHVDYAGLISWYEGTWQAKNILSQTYIKMIRAYQTSIDINFIKVKAHEGNRWNEHADMLAKKSIGK